MSGPSLFDTPSAHPPGWRAPTDPREHTCRTCAGAASCGIGDAWYCVPDYFPHTRAEGAR